MFNPATPNTTDREVAGYIVRRARIIGTAIEIFTVYEPMRVMGSHQTITTIGGSWYGAVTSRRDDSSFAHLAAGSLERCAAVDAYYTARYAECYDAILLAYPEAAEGRRSAGKIELIAE